MLRNPYHRAAARYRIARASAFIELWRDCDPELRPLVEEARSPVATLAAKGS